MNTEELKNYTQVRTPDVAALANCINKAKGPQRTMAQFAADTNISASTLSRIVNLNIKMPLSKEMIVSIYNHRADERDVQLLVALIRANGMAPAEYAERVSNKYRGYARHNEEVNVAYLMKNAILAGMAASGMPIESVHDGRIAHMKERKLMGESTLRYRPCDFIVFIGKNLSTISQWKIYTFPRRLEADDYRYEKADFMMARSILNNLAPLFLTDVWEPDSLRGTKTSFAFADKNLFYAFINLLHSASINNEMSILLLDPDNGYAVVDEVWIKGNYVGMSNISIFECPAPVSEEDEYDDEYNDYYEYDEEEDFE